MGLQIFFCFFSPFIIILLLLPIIFNISIIIITILNILMKLHP